MMRKHLCSAIVCLAIIGVLGWASPGRCATWYIDYISYGSASVTGSVYSGDTAYVGLFEATNSTNPSTVWTGYCIDIQSPVDDSWTYTGEEYQGTWNTLDAGFEEKLYQAAWMMWNYDPFLSDGSLSGSATETELVIALQLAIWELFSETESTLDVTDGELDFFNPTDGFNPLPNVLALANSILDGLAGAGSDIFNIGNSVLLQNGESDGAGAQDLLLGTPSAVPEPASMLLFASASGAMLLFRRKIWKKTK